MNLFRLFRRKIQLFGEAIRLPFCAFFGIGFCFILCE
jgi:hypothetical protein